MTEQELRQGLTRSLAGADLPDCRKREVLAMMKGDAPMKKRMKFTYLLALMALLLAATATAAVAGSMFLGTVDWQGQPKAEEVVSMAAMPAATALPTVTPTTPAARQPVSSVARFMAVQTLLNEEAARAAGDLVILSEGDDDPTDTLVSRRSSIQRTRPVAAYTELEALVADTSLPLPAALPEGYSITGLRVSCDCLIAGEYTLVSSVEHTLPLDGSTVSLARYHASEAHDVITGYLIELTNSAGDTLSINASLTPASGDTSFGLWDDETACAVDVPGMENALLVEGSARTQLYMRRTLDAPVSVITPLHLDAEDPDRVKALGDLYIRVHATALSGDALLALFSD